jgi:hypothetical protein
MTAALFWKLVDWAAENPMSDTHFHVALTTDALCNAHP